MLAAVARTSKLGGALRAAATASHGAWARRLDRAFTGGPVGQPTPETHPHFLKPGELTPGITTAEYAARRAALAARMPPGSLVIIPSAPLQFVTGKIPHAFRQEADFLYLTGLDQEITGAVMMLMTPRSSDQAKEPLYTLAIPNNEIERVRWDGLRVGPDAARAVFGAEEVLPLHALPRELETRLEAAQMIFYDPDRAGGMLTQQAPALLAAVRAQRVHALRPHVHALRWKKSLAEQALMRAAAAASADAIAMCMQESFGGVDEHRLSCTFERETKRRGAKRMAYPQVVGGGANACTIHYGRNDGVAREGELMLMDAGCEMHGYASDVTRTWPVSGKFSSPQKDLYTAVLETHMKCIEACNNGSTLRQLHHLSVQLLSEALVDLGVCKGGGVGFPTRSVPYRPFYPHSVGHWLGMDTHDSATIPLDRAMEPGVVLTLEPGLYLPDIEEVPKHLRGLGVRIEDDILIGERGEAIVISDQVPKEVGEVEALVGQARAHLVNL